MNQDSNAGLHPEDSFAFRKISDWLNHQIQKLKAYNDSQKKVLDPYLPILPDFMERGSGMTRWGFNPDGSVAFIRFGPELWLQRNPETNTFAKIWMGGLTVDRPEDVSSDIEAIRNWFDRHEDDWSPIPTSLLAKIDLYDPEVVVATGIYPDFTRHADGHRGSRAPLELRLAFRAIHWLPSLIERMNQFLRIAERVAALTELQITRPQECEAANRAIELPMQGQLSTGNSFSNGT